MWELCSRFSLSSAERGQHCSLWYSVDGKKKWREKRMSIEKIISEISQQELSAEDISQVFDALRDQKAFFAGKIWTSDDLVDMVERIASAKEKDKIKRTRIAKAAFVAAEYTASPDALNSESYEETACLADIAEQAVEKAMSETEKY